LGIRKCIVVLPYLPQTPRVPEVCDRQRILVAQVLTHGQHNIEIGNCFRGDFLGHRQHALKKFHIFRKKRNISDYERADTISASDVEEMRSLAEKLRGTSKRGYRKTILN
jgi:hypothetical protein